jgi:hypothetical protein
MRVFFITIFYKLHQLARLFSKDNLYHYTAMYLLSLLIFLNCITVIAYYRCLLQHASMLFPSRATVLSIAFLIAGINYFYFVRNKKYESHFEELDRRLNLKNNSGTFITVAYSTVTLGLLFSTIWLKCR